MIEFNYIKAKSNLLIEKNKKRWERSFPTLPIYYSFIPFLNVQKLQTAMPK